MPGAGMLGPQTGNVYFVLPREPVSLAAARLDHEPIGSPVLSHLGPRGCRCSQSTKVPELKWAAILGTGRRPRLCWFCGLGGLSPFAAPSRMAQRSPKLVLEGRSRVLASPLATVDELAFPILNAEMTGMPFPSPL